MLTDMATAEIVQRMIEKLKEMHDASRATTSGLLLDLGYDLNIIDEDLNSIHFALFEAAENEDLLLDMSSHEDRFEGLPYNLDFQVFHRNQKEHRGNRK